MKKIKEKLVKFSDQRRPFFDFLPYVSVKLFFMRLFVYEIQINLFILFPYITFTFIPSYTPPPLFLKSHLLNVSIILFSSFRNESLAIEKRKKENCTAINFRKSICIRMSENVLYMEGKVFLSSFHASLLMFWSISIFIEEHLRWK